MNTYGQMHGHTKMSSARAFAGRGGGNQRLGKKKPKQKNNSDVSGREILQEMK